MKKPISLLTLLFFLSVTACAQHAPNMTNDHHVASPSPAEAAETQEWAKARLAKSPRHQEWVKIKNGAREVSSFVVYPESKKKSTAVVVIHEIFGMSDWVQSLTDQLAEAGYIAIAPDLLSGMGPNGGGTSSLDRNQIGQKIRDLPADQITGDLNAVVDYVSKLPASNGKVVVTGYCWGGSQSFAYATNNPNIKAAFVFYGSAPTTGPDGTIDKAALARIKAPVYGFYAGNDARINATLPATTEAMKELNKKFEPVTYDGAGHGFMRAGEAPEPTDTTAADYQKQLDTWRLNRTARDEAWARWKKLLAAI
ncbi:MAG TPA: dienelactone hydrolase family protein [Pyrinomonadaceae bacterium]|nr:dienelactone hydrolase family protein [Pyrinomonadaceae bacterium]